MIILDFILVCVTFPQYRFCNCDSVATSVPQKKELVGCSCRDALRLSPILGGPPLVSQGGQLDSSGYWFGPNQGLSLVNSLLDTSHYSIEMSFHLSEVTGLKKIVDLTGLARETGIYNMSGRIAHWDPLIPGPLGALLGGVKAHLVLTRDGNSGDQSFTCQTVVASAVIGGYAALIPPEEVDATPGDPLSVGLHSQQPVEIPRCRSAG